MIRVGGRRVRLAGLLIGLCLMAGLLTIIRAYVRESPQTLTVAVAEQPAMALIFIADKQGYFDKEGLQVNFHRFLLGRDALQDTLEDKADLATVYDIPTVHAILSGEDVGILTSLHTSTKNHAIAAFKKTGITTAQDLEGKRIAVTKGTSTEYFLSFYLMLHGIDKKNITVVDVEPEVLVSQLQASKVDAAVLFNPYLFSFIHNNPSESYTLLYESAYTEMSLLVGKQLTIKNKGSEVTKFMKSLVQAEKFAKAHKAESIGIVEDWLQHDNRESVVATWDAFTYSITLSNLMMTNLEREASYFTLSNGKLGNIPLIRQVVLPEYIETVKPEGMTL